MSSYFDDSDSDKEKKEKYDSDEDDKETDDENELEIEDDESIEDAFDLDGNIESLVPGKEKNTEIDEEINEELLQNEDFDVSSDEEDETYLQKFNKEVNRNYIVENHPECVVHNNHEIETLSAVTRDETNAIIDDNHRTLPILTKYEKTRIIGQRAKQINQGSQPYVDVPTGVIDGYIIAEMELRQKKIPFIIQRPLPNGSKEFWKIEDLEQVDF
jgi:DNA-directed RNA polymerase subunit K/omega